jgi:hypothetical protein
VRPGCHGDRARPADGGTPPTPSRPSRRPRLGVHRGGRRVRHRDVLAAAAQRAGARSPRGRRHTGSCDAKPGCESRSPLTTWTDSDDIKSLFLSGQLRQVARTAAPLCRGGSASSGSPSGDSGSGGGGRAGGSQASPPSPARVTADRRYGSAGPGCGRAGSAALGGPLDDPSSRRSDGSRAGLGRVVSRASVRVRRCSESRGAPLDSEKSWSSACKHGGQACGPNHEGVTARVESIHLFFKFLEFSRNSFFP